MRFASDNSMLHNLMDARWWRNEATEAFNEFGENKIWRNNGIVKKTLTVHGLARVLRGMDARGMLLSRTNCST